MRLTERAIPREGLGVWTVAIAVAVLAHDPAFATSRSSNPIAVAVTRGDCKQAVELIRAGVSASDYEAFFLGARMLDEGICMREDAEGARRLFEVASRHGHRDSSLELATKFGLGDGVEQNFERAGEICRASGLDPLGQLSAYSLGYACTLRGVAGKILRVTLPVGAFRPQSGDAVVEFNPASVEMRVKSMPPVGREADAFTGSNIARKKIHGDREIQSAWEKARERVPRPDAQRLDSKFIELAIDLDPVLEDSAGANRYPAFTTLDFLDPPTPQLFDPGKAPKVFGH